MRKLLILILVIITAAVAGCKTIPAAGPGDKKEKLPLEEIWEENDEFVRRDPVKELLSELTLAEKIGQMVIIGFNDTFIDASLEKLVTENHVGGIIFFGRNIKDSAQLEALTKSIKELNSMNRLPLFIAVDEEGGTVTRLPTENTRFPSSRELGKKNDSELSFANGQAIGSKLASFDFNMNFAPVLDIHSNPQNTVIGSRSFGADPGLVARLGVAVMAGLQNKGIISVIKHFPGHGDTSTDSHYVLPVLNHDRERLDSFELIPFREAIKAGADAVMTAHIRYSKIDESGRPATLAPAILTGLLREELGFNGVIITDDLEMGAITRHYDIKEAALEAVKAGADILLISHTYKLQQDALDALHEAVEAGDLSEQRIDESVERIIRLKLNYNLF
ncbi:MAG: beta-N-acetylhexosaminidase [Dethiobacter sp.]|jgi:beta-N-acetylhexosaminidase|nr:beta-N-acetylhexosaminidase [Dethiobacter sp.]